ncbi:hypothetical protein DF16_pBMB293orf00015 (plasmid) [Bacillus thuringiensis serovar kurstaki str. YBT-1520]|nr:hypothetical protein DF16_pBMB293orf00015 [Bacillus thuringiensis serovar kurstaki str. YBT-1520]
MNFLATVNFYHSSIVNKKEVSKKLTARTKQNFYLRGE